MLKPSDAPGWEGVRGLFESWAAQHGPDPDGSRTTQVIKPIMDLGLTLRPEDEARPMALFKQCNVRIDGDTAFALLALTKPPTIRNKVRAVA